MAHERVAKSLGVNLIQIHLESGPGKNEWVNPSTGQLGTVENAVLGAFRNDGWNGFAGEGGLILNLIKTMSFPQISYADRTCLIEATYAQNVGIFSEKHDIEWLLNNVASASIEQVVRNTKVITSRDMVTIDYGAFTSKSDSCVLDYYPDLKLDMFVDLFESLGRKKIHEIATIFAQDPYTFRSGWPDITMWKNGSVKFLEVKAPGDRIHASQKRNITHFMKPLELDFSLVDVTRKIKTEMS